MIISSRVWTIALAAAIPLAACSREEPKTPSAPAAAVKPAAQAPPAGQAPAAKAAAAPVVDQRLLENGTASEPGFLTAFADADESIGEAPFTIKLNVEVVDNTGTPPYTFVWDFGDATEFSSDKSPTHIYKIPGSFRASVIIRDSKGEVDQDYIDVAVSDPNAPQGLTAEELMQQVPIEEVVRHGAAGATGAAKAPAAGGTAPSREADE